MRWLVMMNEAAPRTTILDDGIMELGGLPGGPPPSGVASDTIPPTEIQRSGARRRGVPGVLEWFSGVLWGGVRGVLSVA